MAASLKVGRIIGIPINIHISFLIILPLFAYIFGFTSTELFGLTIGFDALDVGWETKALLGTAAAIAFFLSVLAHELAHSYVALRSGYRISGITLLIFGGVSQIEETPDEAPNEAVMAFVGPGMSFLIGTIFFPLAYLLDTFDDGIVLEAAVVFTGLLGTYNLILGAFNLLPAFPMDGGRIVRAWLARRMDFVQATETAVQIGKFFAIAMAVFGFLTLNVWLLIIALFIYIAAGEEERSTQVTYSLKGMRVRDLMSSPVSTVTPETTISELLDRMMEEKHMGFPVVKGGELMGMVTLEDASRVEKGEQWMIKVGQVMAREVEVLSPGDCAKDALEKMTQRKVGRLPVVDDGELVGILTRTDLMRAFSVMAAKA